MMDQRSRFEAWCKSRGFPVDHVEGTYKNNAVQTMWFAWKNCAAWEAAC